MARAARADRAEQTAGRIAARRSRAGKPTDQASRRTPPRGARAQPSRSGRRLLKLGLLVGACCLVGFFVVLVVDVGAKLVGHLNLGGSSMAQLVDRVVDRVLDRDVPRSRDLDKPRSEPARPASPGAAPKLPRAPQPATRPEDDARHVQARPDPQVEQAKQRLDEILRRL